MKALDLSKSDNSSFKGQLRHSMLLRANFSCYHAKSTPQLHSFDKMGVKGKTVEHCVLLYSHMGPVNVNQISVSLWLQICLSSFLKIFSLMVRLKEQSDILGNVLV